MTGSISSQRVSIGSPHPFPVFLTIAPPYCEKRTSTVRNCITAAGAAGTRKGARLLSRAERGVTKNNKGSHLGAPPSSLIQAAWFGKPSPDTASTAMVAWCHALCTSAAPTSNLTHQAIYANRVGIRSKSRGWGQYGNTAACSYERVCLQDHVGV